MDYGYIRYSSGRQERGSSVARQEELIKLRCPDIATENIYIDRGVSAFKGSNLLQGSEWYKLMEVVESGSTIYVEQVDRVTRKGLDEATKIIRELRLKGVSVVTTFDGKRYQGGVDTTLEEGITLMLAGELGKTESATKSRRVAASYVTRNDQAAEGKKIKIPLASWLKFENGVYVVDDAKAEIVKEIFKLCLDGLGAAAIAIELNNRKIKPFRFDRKEKKETKEKKEKLWGAASVYVVLKNKASYGTFTPNAWKVREAKRLGEVFENTATEIEEYFPTVVSKDVFWKAQEELRARKLTRATRQSKEGAQFNLWQGVAVCGDCGSRLHIMAKGKNKERYLVCSGKVRNKNCTNGNVREDVAEGIFKEILTKINVVELLEGVKKNTDIQATKTRLAEVENELVQITADLSERYSRGLSDVLHKREQEAVALKEKIAAAEHEEMQEVMLLESKKWILANLKLETREQRSKANSLVKRLGIEVEITRNTEYGGGWIIFEIENLIKYGLGKNGELAEFPQTREIAEKLDQHNANQEQVETPEEDIEELEKRLAKFFKQALQ